MSEDDYMHDSYCKRCRGTGIVPNPTPADPDLCPNCDGLGINPDDKFAFDYFRKLATGASAPPKE